MRPSYAIESDIVEVERRLFTIKDELAQLNDAATNLSLSAANQRARNAELGRGLGGALFGAKYRAAARRTAASSNAAIGREVAAKRQAIAHAKQSLREQERDLRWDLRDLKADLRDAKAEEREAARAPQPAPRVAPPRASPPPLPVPDPAPALSVKEELRRLKSLHEQGTLDAGAYERARIALLQPHLRG